MDKIFQLLKIINDFDGINQRTLSKQSGISLGKVNMLIEKMESEQYISKTCIGKEHKYTIEKDGLQYMENYLTHIQNNRLTLEGPKGSISTAVVLSAGKNDLFEKPIALLNVENSTMISRTIQQLKETGIDKIIVVIGYMASEVRTTIESLQFDNIIIVENLNYNWTGTMASLSMASPYISEDFLLVEGDIVIENQGIVELLNDKQSNSMLITTESGSGDEAFIEIRNQSIFKISKDIRQLNKIDGEMIGVSKLSYPFYKKMLEIFLVNENPYLNYEYLMLDISRQYTLGFLKLDNLLWHEIDTHQHKNYVESILLPKIERKELSIKLENLRSIVCDVMNVEDSDIFDISPIGGMTNKNYKVVIKEESYVLRVPGNGTEEMINRLNEKNNSIYANEIGIDAELLYFNVETGIKVSKFIKNAETLNPDSARRHANMKLTTSLLKRLHQSKKVMQSTFNVFNEIEKYESILDNYNIQKYEDYQKNRDIVFSLMKDPVSKETVLCPCHNDLVPENIIKSNEIAYLIDWEYAGMNDPMWDLAAHILECDFSEEEENRFVSMYFGEEVNINFKKRIVMNKIYQDFLWSIWTLIKEAKGDDFGDYGQKRYNRAIQNINVLNRIKGE